MSYTALYRKFRPKTFEDVKGQDPIVTTLKNQIKNERTSHAYLFCGTRGTGKTTIAKIFARAVNCENPVDGSPCGECEMCKSILEGSSMNVIEMDAASNNSVDNVRQIVDEVSYSPTAGKYKVYIIDEVHMLSGGAFNALLKTLEEPPSYVIFILATTEVHKIPITILSRCQRYDFRRISLDTIGNRIKELTDIEKVSIEDKAIRYIAKAADGSMRDALSLLDQCIAFYFGKELTYDRVLDVLGAVDTEVFSRILRCIIESDVTGALKVLEEIVIQGRELGQFVTDMTWYMRNLLLIKTAEANEDIIDLSTDNMLRLKEEAKMCPEEVIVRYIRVMSELSGQLRYATQKRVMVEVAIIKLCRPVMEQDMDSILDRLRLVEKMLENGVPIKQGSVPLMPVGDASKPKENVILPKALPEDIRDAVANWGMLVSESEYRMYLDDAYPSIEGEDTLAIVFRQSFSIIRFNNEDEKEKLRMELSSLIGHDLKISIKSSDSNNDDGSVYPDIRAMVDDKIDFEIEEIDEIEDDDDDSEEFEPIDLDE